MADELGLRLGKVSIAEAEKLIINIEEKDAKISVEECRRSLFWKIVGEKKANWLGIKRTMGMLWRLGNSFEVRELNSHGVPINCNELKWGIKLERAFNGVKNVILARAGNQEGRIIRLQAILNIREPLPRWTTIRLGDQVVTIQFKYEKIVSLCYYCGRLGHVDKNCPKRKDDIMKKSVNEGQYGEWLKAAEGVVISESPPASKNSEPSSSRKNVPSSSFDQRETVQPHENSETNENEKQGVHAHSEGNIERSICVVESSASYAETKTQIITRPRVRCNNYQLGVIGAWI
ncbi:Unknown protein [Striga hermonthica]|uniref:CCHC-type domain-containing protein n=1 Tax=Striga hermonthica TaxID=68872 RepID=A0A9N7RIX9_STRHE|nr:Unknown protein [Striga hermonthica]